ncbi:N-acetylneuraminate synthase [Glaciecola punicea]|uniref:N-acetylneuraminate synthase n=1 Tax=Glaciecola punicea TaxID=56804 RepID=UPI000872B49A|nr:N-acetylneuraminate synthase [Glaciecola punicea]OFA32761.1 N-acetylneuraminate synthase [Glaciecola punicea]
MNVLVIAEAGVNHNGQENLAFELVIAAKNAGADIVKFQTFKAAKLVTADAEQCEYQISNTGKKESQLSMLSRLELSYEAHHKLLAQCNKLGIEFLSTAFDSQSLNFLVHELGLKRLKIPSGDLTNAPLILEHARTGCDLIVSTGMASLAEIETALGVIAFGYTYGDIEKPSIQAFEKAYYSELGQKMLREKVTILHCTTEYPAPLKDINLRAMNTIANAFKLPVGYSDHSAGINIPIAAVARGAKIIEKHFTLDQNMEGPDHKASLEPDQLKRMIEGIRDIEIALGDGLKGPRPSEIKNKSMARKSLVAEQLIKKGTIFNEDNLVIKRPGLGINPIHYWDLIGSSAKKDYNVGDFINE